MPGDKRKAVILGGTKGLYKGVLDELGKAGFKETSESGLPVLRGELEGEKVDVYFAFGGEHSELTERTKQDDPEMFKGVPYVSDVVENLNHQFEQGKISSVTMLGVTGAIDPSYKPGDIVVPGHVREIIVQDDKVGVSKDKSVDNKLSGMGYKNSMKVDGYEGSVKGGSTLISTPAHLKKYMKDPVGFAKQLEGEGVNSIDMETAIVVRRCKAPVGAALVVSDRVYSNEDFGEKVFGKDGRLGDLNKELYGVMKQAVKTKYA